MAKWGVTVFQILFWLVNCWIYGWMLVIQWCARGAVKHNLQTYIQPYIFQNENFEKGYPHPKTFNTSKTRYLPQSLSDVKPLLCPIENNWTHDIRIGMWHQRGDKSLCYMTHRKDLLWLAKTSFHMLWQILMSTSYKLN